MTDLTPEQRVIEAAKEWAVANAMTFEKRSMTIDELRMVQTADSNLRAAVRDLKESEREDG